MLHSTVLPNGIKVVSEKISHAHSISIGIWVKTGSRFEKKEEQGICHFIEHMLFKGTARYNAFDIAKTIDSVGGYINAFTGKEYTCVYVKVLNQHLSLAIDLLKDIFLNSLFAIEDIEKERNVIMQEINMIKDTPDEYIQDLFNGAYFSGHPLGYPILGELETIQSMSRQHLLKFFNTEYLAPTRIVIAAAGNVEHGQLLDEIGDAFSGLQLQPLADCTDSFVPQHSLQFNYRKLEQIHICIGTIGMSQHDPQRYTLYVLNTLFGGSISSRLFQEIREKHGLAYSVYSFISSYYDTGLLGIYMGVKRDTVQEALTIAFREIGRLKTERIEEEELTSAKEQLKGNMLLSAESTDNRMSRLAKCEIYYNKYIPIEEVVSEIETVSADDIHALAHRTFDNKLINYTFLGPLKQKHLPAELLQI